MSLTVAKFGGSSVCDAHMFRAVYDIISSGAGRKYIILSAPGKRYGGDEKITDLLLRAHAAKPPEDQFIFAQIFQRYSSIRDALCPSFDLEGECDQIFAHLHASPDFAASRGEYLCAKLFSACFGIPFIDAKDLLFFDLDGSIDCEKSFRAIRNTLSKHERAVIPGFYAASPNGLKTFTRGGSDVSGAWIAAALKADIYENWTDVDGVYSADPVKVTGTVRHGRISFRQMHQLALAGAKVLHPDALLPLKGRGIDTHIRNTFRPTAPGTIISERFDHYVPAVTGACPVYFNQENMESAVPLNAAYTQDSMPVGVISVFGAGNTAYAEIVAKYKSIHIIHMPEHIQIITSIPEYQTTLEDIHRILVKNMDA